ncbi:hypothetical protein LSAT2_002175 [Lamellibrachia satsuma]|nr:hypothetical protein LSAT2_002175 [Lamellibrachia satsuma]
MTNDEMENERRGGLCSGMAAVMFGVSGMCFCLSIAGVSLDYWIQIGPFHVGLFGFPSKAFIKASQAFCVMGVIAAGIMFISAVIYNFVHAVPKGFALGMFNFCANATCEISKTYILSSVRLEVFPLCMQEMLLYVLTTSSIMEAWQPPCSGSPGCASVCPSLE